MLKGFVILKAILTSDMTNIRIAIFEPTQMSCELVERALEASPYHIQVMASGTSSDLNNDPQLDSASVVVTVQVDTC